MSDVSVRRVAMIGWGRFGEALGGLFVDAGVEVRAWDPTAAPPPGLRAPSVADAVRGADVVALAVPVRAMTQATEAVRPHAHAGQLVFDVASVKVRPEEALRAAFGDAIPWVATHPLFGPTSLALAERPLRVIVCPNATHPGAATRARALYERIGCLVSEQDAHAHDRAMAETHAVAFFIAKGMLDAAVGSHVAYAPPSFQAIARTVEVVRSDAGHLFRAIVGENPYAAGTRARLLEALAAVDATLARAGDREGPDAPPASEGPLSIPDLGATSPALRETRQLIDEIDRELVALLARRAELARRARKAKAELGAGVHDGAREASLLEARRAWAADAGLDGESVEDVFRAVLRFSRRIQGGGPGGAEGGAGGPAA